MALGFLSRPKDCYLVETVRTERFKLVNCSWLQAVRTTLPWANDPDTLHALMYESTSYSRLHWAAQLDVPDGRNLFFHAIVTKDGNETIGAHRIRLNRSGTANMGIALTDKTWWGKGVFEEVRGGLMDHFSQSPRVVRFAGRVLARNVSSVYNYKKLGFRFIGHDCKSWRSPLTGELMDTMYFECLAEDWRASRGLEPG
ncbi:GNAT family N-acetyltransferase [Marimonas sp. MJW-29]|uniref:GNAT family N-acetyltransferase n=1 Tax=Sulfitobacter sediminis TaxID=3234186 RepID=A0ABV3RPL8_9RHOB